MRFRIQSAQYANGPYEVAYLIVDDQRSILLTETDRQYAKEITALLNIGYKNAEYVESTDCEGETYKLPVERGA